MKPRARRCKLSSIPGLDGPYPSADPWYSFVTVTERVHHCVWCGGAFPAPVGPGRPRRYCRPSHRQRAYEARREADRRGLRFDEVIVSHATWELLSDSLYRLESAAEDVAVDLVAGRTTKRDYVEALAHLSSAVRDLKNVAIEPTAIGPEE